METTTELTLAIEPRSDPIAGRIRFPDGSVTPFEGYLQLVAAVERARGDETEPELSAPTPP